MPTQYGRGTYGQRGSAVETILAEMAEKARAREEQQRQEAMQQQRMKHETVMGQQDMNSRYIASLLQNSGDPRAWEIVKSLNLGVDLPEYRQLPAEQARDLGAKDAIDYYGNREGMAPGFRAMSAFQMGTGAALPTHGQAAAVNQDLYTRPNMPQAMVEGADIGSGRKLSAKDAADVRLNALRTAAQNAADYARANASNADAAATRGSVAAGGAAPTGGYDPSLPTGEAYLKTLDPFTANLIKGIANYTVDLTKVSSLRGGAKGAGSERKRLTEQVMQYDPTFDMSQFPIRSKTRQSFTSGKDSFNVTSLNTAVKHVAALKRAADSLDNYDTKTVNRVTNFLSREFGDPRVTNFNAAATAVADELSTLFKGTAGTDEQIKAWRAGLSENMSKEQYKGQIEMLLELMGGRLGALETKYREGMGREPDFDILTPESKKVLTSVGLDPALLTGTAHGATGVPGSPNTGRMSKEQVSKKTGARRTVYSDDGGATWHP